MINSPNTNIYSDLPNGMPNDSGQEPPAKPETTALDEVYAVARIAAQAVRRERERILRERLFARLDAIKKFVETEGCLHWRVIYELKNLATDFKQDADDANLAVSVQPPNSYEFGHPFKPRT